MIELKEGKERSAKAEEILDVAERMARIGGYNGFSFREIAKEVGIKSASVHYHFPGKAELGAALAQRYTGRFLDGLGAPDEPGAEPEVLLKRYVAAYRSSLVDDGLMCLCGMLGAEIAYLPEAVAQEARGFFQANIAWLTAVLARKGGKRDARAEAMRMVATLEGALIVARSLDDTEAFDAVTRDLLKD